RLSLKQCEDVVRQCLEIWGLDPSYMPKVKDARKNGVTAFGGPNDITLPKWARDKVIVAHESAHCILMRVCGDPEAHGAEWMRVYCLLLARLYD
ncbi:hypothetical protein ACI4BE_27765, partial [Klebsiella pneumoniae]|uniref:hypothetical protein n=1 Tax=Klebsiella pneumoniae TaxID=573 RepID=UPI0038524A7A